MQSNNNSISSFILLILCLFTFATLTLLLLGLYKTDRHVKSLSADIHALKTHNSNYKSDIESMERQIISYRLEINELKDTAVTYDAGIQEVISIPVKEYSDSDMYLLAQLIESESGNQPFEGKLAVGTVVMNRVESDGFPDTIRGVIFQKGQFSVVPNGAINNKPSSDSLKAATEILEGSRVLASNVLYFYNPEIVKKTNWIRTRKVTKQISNHAFAV